MLKLREAKRGLEVLSWPWVVECILAGSTGFAASCAIMNDYPKPVFNLPLSYSPCCSFTQCHEPERVAEISETTAIRRPEDVKVLCEDRATDGTAHA